MRFSRADIGVIVVGLGIIAVACLFFGSISILGGYAIGIAFYLGLISLIFVIPMCLVFALYWKGRRRFLPLLFLLIYPITVSISIVVADRFSPESRREAYGEVIAQQLDRYRADYGNYPETLDQLVPSYLDDLKEPETVWGWLYVATDDGFSLGYVARVDRWGGYSVSIYPSETRAWDFLVFSDGPFDLPPATPQSF